jgi:hypothetical protein
MQIELEIVEKASARLGPNFKFSVIHDSINVLCPEGREQEAVVVMGEVTQDVMERHLKAATAEGLF